MYTVAKVCSLSSAPRLAHHLQLIYLLAIGLCYGSALRSTARELELGDRETAYPRDLTIYSNFRSCALTDCRAGTSASCQQLDLQLETCVQITPSFQSFGSCVVNWPTDGRYCTTAIYADRSCRLLITEMDPTQDDPCVSCFNAVPDSTSYQYPLGAQSVKFYCTGIAVPDVTATIAPYKSNNCLNEPWLESLSTTQLGTNGCVALQDRNQLAAGLLSFRAKMNGPVNPPTYCKVQVYADPFCQIQVGVLDPVYGFYGRCISTFLQDVTGGSTGIGNTGNSALLRCYTT